MKIVVLTAALSTLVVVSALVRVSAQQAPPASEIFLAALAPQGGSLQVVNISNSPGYDNQPSFLPDSSAVLFTSYRDGKQTDIYRYDISGHALTQVTATPEAEYSPTVTPDRKTFTAVRVEADQTQRLWRFNLDGSNPHVILENVKPVGYHAWIDDTHLALFVLGTPATLQLADTTTGEAKVVATGIGRTVLVRPGKGTISYLATGEAPRVLKELDLKTGTSTTLIAPLEGSEYCAWLPDGRLLMAKGSVISSWKPGTDSWTTFADVPPTNITRLAVSPDGKWIAFVADQR
jgi:Tol biopolymer transport system component